MAVSLGVESAICPPDTFAKCVGCNKKKPANKLPEQELLDIVNQKTAPATAPAAKTATPKPSTADGFSAIPVPAGGTNVSAPSGVALPLQTGTQSMTLQTGTESTTLQTGTQSTTLQTGTQSTTLQTGTESTTLQTGTQNTTLQGGAYGTILQANVQRQGGPVNILILVDASRSMTEPLKGGIANVMGISNYGTQKMDAAKIVLQNTLARIPQDINLGLRVFGQGFDNNPMTDCTKSVLLVPLGKNNRRLIRDAVGTLKPFGLTPLTYALLQAERDLRDIQGTKTVILISDGVDTCGGDPCELIRKMEAMGIHIKVDIVGLGLGRDAAAKEQLNCISEASGGKFYDANTAGELVDSINVSVKQAIQGKVITKVRQPNQQPDGDGQSGAQPYTPPYGQGTQPDPMSQPVPQQ